MKLKENFILRQIADTWVVFPIGDTTVNFNGMLKLNESGALLWRTLEQGGKRDDLANVLMKEYIVEYEQALADVDEFMEILVKAGCVE